MGGLYHPAAADARGDLTPRASAKQTSERLQSNMKISIATANLYFLPFQQTLEIIVEAGFGHIELDLYWERGQWAIAQHLKGVGVRQVVDMISRSGLTVSSIHDTGGVVNDAHSIQGFIHPQLREYVDQLGYAPGCIVFHTPHIEGPHNHQWWQTVSDDVVKAVESYRSSETSVTLENMPLFDGYYVPLTTPQELLTFVSNNELGVTLDTTHYAQIGVDVVQAACVLQKRIRTIHLGDFVDGKTHVFIGDGELDFSSLFRVLEPANLHSITLECSVGFLGENTRDMTPTEVVARLKTAMSRLQSWKAANPRMQLTA
jgi:sugar phosphate isomerase/epimerase